jgi:hypothetical protein
MVKGATLPKTDTEREKENTPKRDKQLENIVNNVLFIRWHQEGNRHEVLLISSSSQPTPEERKKVKH